MVEILRKERKGLKKLSLVLIGTLLVGCAN